MKSFVQVRVRYRFGEGRRRRRNDDVVEREDVHEEMR